MRILSNGFPTNLPDSETVSQGGPANFARLFKNHIISSNSEHFWIGVVMQRSDSTLVSLKHVFSSNYRRYILLRIPPAAFRRITRAKKGAEPQRIFGASIKKLCELINDEKPDVIFLNGFGLLNWMLLKAGEATGTPVVIQHAGIWGKELAIHRDLYTEYGRKIMEGMERDATRIAAVEIFLNRWSRDYYRTNIASGDLRRTEIIPLPFDFESFNELSSGVRTGQFDFPRTQFHIGIIARWDEIKNHAAIVAMAKEARRRKLPWKFHAVVDIPENKESEKEVKEYRRFVDVIPPLDRSGISDFCRSVDLLMLPSLFDVSPTVVLEAIALDTPIAISPTIGYVDDFKGCGAGEWVIDPSNTMEAVNALQRLEGRKMPMRLRDRLRDIHDHRKVFAAYLEIFESAHVRGLPIGKVLRVLWKKEMSRYFSSVRPTGVLTRLSPHTS